jgi:hypothetical protein
MSLLHAGGLAIAMGLLAYLLWALVASDEEG